MPRVGELLAAPVPTSSFEVKTASFTPLAGRVYAVDTSAGAFSVVLPTGASGELIGFEDAVGSDTSDPTGFGLHPLTINPPSGGTIQSRSGVDGQIVLGENEAVFLRCVTPGNWRFESGLAQSTGIADGTVTVPKMGTDLSSLVYSRVGFRNAVINGRFDYWQRGTSHSATGYGSADRFFLDLLGSTCTLSRQAFTFGQTDVPGHPDYFARLAVATAATPNADARVIFSHRIEDVSRFAGQTVTFSAWMRANATKSVAVELAQFFGTGGSTPVFNIGTSKFVVGTSWQRFSFTAVIPSLSGKSIAGGNDSLYLSFWLDCGSTFNSRTNNLGPQSGTFDIALIQLELGEIATPFEYRPPGIELMLCQRYYYSADTFGHWFSPPTSNDANGKTSIVWPTTMRSTPSVVGTKNGGGNAALTVESSTRHGASLAVNGWGNVAAVLLSIAADAEL